MLGNRLDESRVISEFLASARWPAALLLEGEAGIGKTTQWLSVIDQAGALGIRVLAARTAAAESVLAYASLADLLGDVEAAVLADLPGPQRMAMDRVLLRGTGDDDEATDPRAVAAGFVSVVERLADESPVIIAIDDLQWLDTSSRQVVAFAARRLVGRIALLGTVRTEPQHSAAVSWLQLPRVDAVSRIRLQPLSLGKLHGVLVDRLGLSLPRPTMVRIHEISGGNPFYALELARTTGGAAPPGEMSWPGTLAELVQDRIGRVGADAREALLVVACAATPSVELVAQVTDSTTDDVVAVLESAESNGIVGIDGERIRFTHPLLAAGVYVAATPTQRRATHRRLAAAIDEPELHARHLALSVTRGDPHTLQALDIAAERALVRGAPAAAAELLDLATGLGGDTPERRIRQANHHYNAGDADRARALLNRTVGEDVSGPIRAQAFSLLGAIEIVDRSHSGAARLLECALAEAAADLAAQVQILVPMSFALYNIDHRELAARRIDDAVARANRLGQPGLLSQALSMRTLIQFWLGSGVDEESLQRAVDLDEGDPATSVFFLPRMHRAILLSCTGRLDEARAEFRIVRQQCIDGGVETDQNFVAINTVHNELWQGDLASATLLADDAMERAVHLGGFHHTAALVMRARCAAYAGKEEAARDAVREVVATVPLSECFILTGEAIMALGFLDVSLGNYEAALEVLEPLLSTFADRRRATEIYVAEWLPDAVEVLVGLGRLAEAEPLVEALEVNGRRLDRAWMLAVGGRCRALLLGAQGHVDQAAAEAEHALTEHDRLPMPFERARTLLVLGQLQRRQRRRAVAVATLQEALAAFEGLGTPLWAEQARRALGRIDERSDRGAVLTASERRIAELVASGMSNREVAAKLFVSAKTVEVHLSRIYRKLGIRSRAELGWRIARPDQ
ncbi:helix-turn-helix transcriptional regulator [Mycolicibacterium mucogenicum]|uniref:helix-turn-helix transcriptional regulator n=1 Tax=Mycolicibacterium mucogenicum TaxID=56689 RepID=UPI000929F627|nr:LuxR family transcriptional regulator [Mycolicibacterium mucogenicum]SHU73023.1 ATP-dependent transcriptional regulator [Mycobacteroides abscessus subsp. abscessus]